ncbi:MAG: reverse transcriptase domain-containing protein [Paraclostridium sp.]|uniref:reverse transcriptase domain-containing protein n=1 Tax=Paraclostridium sp. TaxID=2023273 RepID=UPI003F2E0F39
MCPTTVSPLDGASRPYGGLPGRGPTVCSKFADTKGCLPAQCLKLGLWNVRGCSTEWKLSSIAEQAAERKFHILTLTETRMKSCNYKLKPNIRIYNSGPGENQKFGGVCFMVIDDRSFEVTDYHELSNRLAILIITSAGTKVGIIGAYAPTECSEDEDIKDDFYAKLTEATKLCDKLSDTTIVMGDFNCRLGNDVQELYGPIIGKEVVDVSRTSENGMRLLDYCYNHLMRIENTFKVKRPHKKFTWYHPGTGNGAVLDYVLMRKNKYISINDVRASRSAEANSDHVLLTVIAQISNGKKHKCRKWIDNKGGGRKICSAETAELIRWHPQNYQAILADRLPDDCNYEEIVKAVLDSAGKVRVPRKKTKAWFDDDDQELHDAIRKQKSLRLTWLRTNSANTEAEYKQQRYTVRRLVRQAKTNYINKLATEFDYLIKGNDTHRAYELLKDVVRLASGKWIDPRKECNSICSNTLCQHYAELFSAHSANSADTLRPYTELDKENDFTMCELVEALKRLRNAKAPGRNGVRPELIRHGGSELRLALLRYFNKCWRGECSIPREWVDADVLSIYKQKGSRKSANNYRSIFLLDAIGKVYATLVCDRISRLSESRIANSQFGFRQNRSTEQAILCLRHIIQNAIDHKAETVITFVDLTKAFDTLPRHLIQRCLQNMGCSSNIMESVNALMNDPVCHLKGSDETFTMKRGVRQGSKEGPLLFNIAFNTILEEAFAEVKNSVGMTDQNGYGWELKHIEYADDLCIITRSVREAEDILVILAKTLNDYDMQMSYDKTKWMIISEEDTSDKLITVEGHQIEKVKCFSYLGSPVSSDGDPTEAVRLNIRRARQCLVRLRPSLRSDRIHNTTKAKVIETFIKPVLLYGLSTIVLRATDNDKMEAVLNTARRMCLGIWNKREMKNVDLAIKIPIRNVATQIQQRRMNLWTSIHKKTDNLAKIVMHSKQQRCNCNRKAYTKNWLRQLGEDCKEIFDGKHKQWINEPSRVVLKDDPRKRPKLVGQRARPIKCSRDSCFRMFATYKEMYHHVRGDHTISEMTESLNRPNQDLIYNCPNTECSKSYKTEGWLKKHIRECHPQMEQVGQLKKAGGQASSTTVINREVRTLEVNLQKCPYEGCTKSLPTWKAIVKHCYRDHKYSATTRKPTVPGKRQSTIEPR